MSLARLKTWISNEILTASALNAEFNNIINNAASLISPCTASFDLDGNTFIMDGAGATTVVSSTSVSWNFSSGSKTGTPGTTGSIANWGAQTYTDSGTAGSGTATAFTAHGFQRPTLAATNSSVITTDAATVYIANAPLAGSNETITSSWALWTDDGKVRHDLTATVPSAAGAVLRGMYLPAVTATISGSTNITTATGFNLVEVGQPTLSAGTALTVTNSATVYIADAPTGGGAGPATITNSYAMWIDGGNFRTDANIILGGDGFIADSSANAYIKFTKTGTAVNWVNIKNNSTGVGPVVSAAGETNVDLTLSPKGSGKLKITDGTDTSKVVSFDASGLTTATTRTITVADLSIAIGKQPTRQTFTSGSGTYTTPSGATRIYVRMTGGGGGGGCASNTPGAATNGGNSTFSTLTANGGSLGSNNTANAAGGTATGGDVNITGGVGGYALTLTNATGGSGGGNQLGPGGSVGGGTAPQGGGGGGGANSGGVNNGSGGGGGAGGYLEKTITSPSATYSYAVGAAGSAGTGGGGGTAGAGGAGIIIVDEFYN